MYTTYSTSASYYQKAYDVNGYGGMTYYTSTTCGYPTAGSWTRVTTGCTTDYKKSEIKYVVDVWANTKLTQDDLKEVDGYKARLITKDELLDNLGYSASQSGTGFSFNADYSPSFVYNSNYSYCTMSSFNDSVSYVWSVGKSGSLYNSGLFDDYGNGVVRPVINLLKSAI